MKTIIKPVFLMLLSLIIFHGCAHKEVKKGASTTNSIDQSWNDMANNSSDNTLPIMSVIEESNSHLFAQIKKDSRDPYLPMFWGESLNFDSGAKKKIVEDKIIEDLQAVFNIKNDNKVVHAGIMHTYGYLFSTIETPYGYKRQRWVSPEVNVSFGLKSLALSPETKEGGLLSNVTYFAGNIAFKNKTDLGLLKNVSNEIFTYDYQKLKVNRLEEYLKDYTLVTSLVSFPTNNPGENDYLLIYSTINKLTNKELLVTVFPINQASYQGIVDPKGLGQNQKIQVRYNAYLGDLGTDLKGTRKLIY